ncbi:MAG: HD domain-containing protein [Candidatus Pacebacteria bacterium]|nr:HD domain-containing protein [Candidatus Paceibacterota bacterium]
MISLKEVQKNPYILEFIEKSQKTLSFYHYTDHGIDHVKLVAKRAKELARKIGMSKREQELSAIAGFCHDMGNFIDRKNHEHWGALLFQTVFDGKISPEDLSIIMQAIANHDDYYAKVLNPVSAVLILADKSDVRRSRVIIKDRKIIERDIHNRVNFAVTNNKFVIDPKRKLITLKLKIDTSFVPVMEYFEIFTQRMVQCRKAAKFLGYNFALIINNFKLL